MNAASHKLWPPNAHFSSFRQFSVAYRLQCIAESCFCSLSHTVVNNHKQRPMHLFRTMKMHCRIQICVQKENKCYRFVSSACWPVNELSNDSVHIVWGISRLKCSRKVSDICDHMSAKNNAKFCDSLDFPTELLGESSLIHYCHIVIVFPRYPNRSHIQQQQQQQGKHRNSIRSYAFGWA